ncbi:hypothetical protein P7K49_008395, partial [Saguinus oedipus]
SENPRVSRSNDYTLPGPCSYVIGRPLESIRQLTVTCRRHRKPAPRSSNFTDMRNPLRVKGSSDLVQTRLEEKVMPGTCAEEEKLLQLLGPGNSLSSGLLTNPANPALKRPFALQRQ